MASAITARRPLATVRSRWRRDRHNRGDAERSPLEEKQHRTDAPSRIRLAPTEALKEVGVKQSYTAHVESAPLPIAITEEFLDAFAAALDRERKIAAPASSSNTATRTIGMTASVDAATPSEAFDAAVQAFWRAADTATKGARFGIAEAGVELDVGDDFERSEIVSAAEVARRVELSRERVRQLAADPRRFPAAIANIRGSKAWRWGDIVDWLEAGGRRGPGRPRKDNAIDLVEALKRSVARERQRASPRRAGVALARRKRRKAS